jgi:hypothetical protein
MRKSLCGSLATALVAIAMAAPSIAAAWGPSKGPLGSEIYVNCAITLDHFPQPIKSTNSSDCQGNASGVLAGLQSNAPGGAVSGVAAVEAFDATAQYTEPLCPMGSLGFSNGTATLGVTEVVTSTKDGVIIVRGRGRYSTPYAWSRAGAVAVITTGKYTPILDAKKGSEATLTWASGSADELTGGLGLGVFVPLGVPPADRVVNCDWSVPGPFLPVSIQALITGL